MKVHFEAGPLEATRPVITLGMFDGIHLGHQWVLSQLTGKARQIQGESVLLTFWPHPRLVLDPANQQISLLSTLEEKISTLEKYGIDHLVILAFTRAISELGSCDFIRDYLVEKLNVHCLIAGFNHHFGKNREGSFEEIQYCAARYGFELARLPEFRHPAGPVSSSIIRKLIEAGQVAMAARLLGRAYSFQGRVEPGNQIGRTLGFPTANLQLEEATKAIPGPGVYAVQVGLGDQMLPGMMNIGFRPTLGAEDQRLQIEVHLIGFSGNLYGRTMTIYVREFLRKEQTFSGLEPLKNQLLQDKENALKHLENLDRAIPGV